MRNRTIIFWLIVVLAFILRFYKLGIVPPSLNWDEVAIGYNAYSLMKTGGFDEYGEFLPLSFRSFDDYKSPLYIYLTTIPVYLFGLNDFAVRFTSALLGTLTVVVTYFLVKELFSTSFTIRGVPPSAGHLGGENSHFLSSPCGSPFGHPQGGSSPSEESLRFHFGPPRRCFDALWKGLASSSSPRGSPLCHPRGGFKTDRTRSFQSKNGLLEATNLALLSSFFLAVSPWHLQSSRVAFEVNSSVFFSVAGTWAFLKGVKGKGGWLLVSAFLFGLNLYTYHNSRVFIPLFSLSLIFLYRKELFKKIKYTFLAVLIAIFFLIPLIPMATSISGQMRFKGTSVFFKPELLEPSVKRITEDKKLGYELLGRIIHNRGLTYLGVIVKNYLSHFRPEFLFFESDMPRHHAPGVGLLYLWDFPFILIGVYYLFKKNLGRSAVVLVSWFLFAPVASSVTWDTPHALRSETFLPLYQIFTAIGVYSFIKLFQEKRKYYYLCLILTFLLFLVNFSYYLHQYYAHMSKGFSKYWQYGRKEAAEFSWSVKDKYEKIIVSTSLEQPYAFFLYYLKYDPKKYLQEGGTVSGGFTEQANKFGKYEFRDFDYKKDREKGRFLFIGSPSAFPPNAKFLKTIYYLDGEEAIKIVES